MSTLHKVAEPPCDMEYIRLRCREIDGCWMWAGAAMSHRWPVMFLVRTGVDGIKREFRFTVRHIVFWLRSGRRPALRPGVAVSTSCGNERCVNPAHVKMMTCSEIQKRATPTQPLMARMRNALTRRRNSKLSDDAVSEIRVSDKPVKVLAEEHDISREYVRQLRRGRHRQQYTGNPFAGLGA